MVHHLVFRMWWISLIPTIPKNEHDGHFTSPKPAEIENRNQNGRRLANPGLNSKK